MHDFTACVQEDDILILASDSLSDNIWDADILGEVARFRSSFIGPVPNALPRLLNTMHTLSATFAGARSLACSLRRCVRARNASRRPASREGHPCRTATHRIWTST